MLRKHNLFYDSQFNALASTTDTIFMNADQLHPYVRRLSSSGLYIIYMMRSIQVTDIPGHKGRVQWKIIMYCVHRNSLSCIEFDEF